MGTSYLTCIIYDGLEDHPHACGDKLYKSLHCPSDTGSSPRVWGQDEKFKPEMSFFGIIPTRVGTRTVTSVTICVVEDHPHACGDKNYNR